MSHFNARKFISKLDLAKNLRSKVLVHAVPNFNVFSQIANDKKIIIPKVGQKKLSKMEVLLGIDKSIHLSLGFDYNAQIFQWPFGFLFDLKLLRSCEFYKIQLVWSAYKKFIDYIYENDLVYFQKLIKKKSIKPILEKYVKTNQKSFDFWNNETEIFDSFINYDKKLLNKLSLKTKSELLLKYPKSLEFSKRTYRKSEQNREIIVNKPLSLKSPYFFGIYAKKIDICIIELAKKLNSKLIYDGKRLVKFKF